MWVTFVYTKLNFPHPLLVLTLFLCFSQIKIRLMQKSAVECHDTNFLHTLSIAALLSTCAYSDGC